MRKLQKIKRRIVSVLAVTALLCTACQKNETTPPENKTVKDITFPLEEPITITAMIRDCNRDKTQYIDQILEEKTNIRFDWTIVSQADYPETLQKKMDAGELPDLFQIDISQVKNTKDKSIFVNYTDYIEQMPNLKNWMEKIPGIYNKSADADGNLYCINAFNTRGYASVMAMYRKDIFEKEGLKAPQTLDELYDALVYLKQKYPDSIPISNRWGVENMVKNLTDLYRVGTGMYLDNEELVYKFGPVTERFKAALQRVRDFYEAGLLDPEFATLSNEQYFDRITSGQTLFLFAEYITALNSEVDRNWVGKGKANNPEFDLVPVNPLVTEYGDTGIYLQPATISSKYCVAVNKNSNYVNEILAYLDYQLSDEIINLANWGVEGETYQVVDGKKEFLIDRDERFRLGVDAKSGMWIPMDIDAVEEGMNPTDAEYVRRANKEMKQYGFYFPKTPLLFNDAEQQMIHSIMDPINQYCEEQYLKFIVGELNMEEDWEQFVKTLDDMGYEKVLQIYQEKYEKLPEERKGLDTELGFH